MPEHPASARRRATSGLSSLLIASACVAPTRVVHAPPPPIMVPAPPPSTPATTDWRDIPLTRGDWSYSPVAGGTAARFAAAGSIPLFAVRCEMSTRTISLARSAASGAVPATMTITTSAGNRTLAATPVTGQAIAASLPARDPFLDKMAFSRGRFVIAVAGTTRLVIPSWPEFARVIEDCRS